MHRLICVFVGCIWQKQVFSWHGSSVPAGRCEILKTNWGYLKYDQICPVMELIAKQSFMKLERFEIVQNALRFEASKKKNKVVSKKKKKKTLLIGAFLKLYAVLSPSQVGSSYYLTLFPWNKSLCSSESKSWIPMFPKVKNCLFFSLFPSF